MRRAALCNLLTDGLNCGFVQPMQRLYNITMFFCNVYHYTRPVNLDSVILGQGFVQGALYQPGEPKPNNSFCAIALKANFYYRANGLYGGIPQAGFKAGYKTLPFKILIRSNFKT